MVQSLRPRLTGRRTRRELLAPVATRGIAECTSVARWAVTWIGRDKRGEFNRSMQHEPRMEVSWCKVFARA